MLLENNKFFLTIHYIFIYKFDIMLQKIKEYILKKYWTKKNIWFFISAFDKNNNLITSHGLLFSDKWIEETIDLVYKWLIQKHEKDIQYVIIDIVQETKNLQNIWELDKIPLSDYGICLMEKEWEKTGILLPNTEWINTIPEALQLIKEKNNLKGDIDAMIFKTERNKII